MFGHVFLHYFSFSLRYGCIRHYTTVIHIDMSMRYCRHLGFVRLVYLVVPGTQGRKF